MLSIVAIRPGILANAMFAPRIHKDELNNTGILLVLPIDCPTLSPLQSSKPLGLMILTPAGFSRVCSLRPGRSPPGYTMRASSSF
jgi:hypothetical protein